MRILRVSLLAVCTVAAAAACAPKRPPAVAPAGPLIQASFAPIELAVAWNTERVSWERPSLVRHADVEARLKAVGSAAPDLFQLEEIGRSVEGRSINHLWFGRGPLHVLLWSQMHGDEPTATAALFDVVEQFRRHRSEPAVRAHPRRADHPHRPDAQPGRRRTLPAPQRPGNRHQPRRAPAADARGPGAQGAARPAEPALSASISTTRAGARPLARPASRPRSRCCRWPLDEARTETRAAC